MKTKTNEDLDPAVLAAELERARAAADVQRVDELERLRARAAHDRHRADVATVERLADLERAERETAAESRARLARLYAEAREAGERTRIRSTLARSGEARALNLEKLRTLNLRALVPVLVGLGAWSTAGVQDGGARLLGVTGGPVWWLLWALEPALIATVVWIIAVRARLAAAGGKLEAGAEWIAGGCLAVSIGLNLIAAAPRAGGWPSAGAMLAHAIGPVGAAAVAYLIGVVDRSIAAADPWHDTEGRPVPVLADLDLRPPAPLAVLGGTENTDTRNTHETGNRNADVPGTAWPVPVQGRRTLPIVARQAALAAGRSTGAQDKPPTPGTAVERAEVRQERRARTDKGTRVPPAARSGNVTNPRTDEALADRWDALVDAGDLAPDAPVRDVKAALRIGADRLQRITILREQRRAAAAHGRVVPLHSVGAGGDL